MKKDSENTKEKTPGQKQKGKKNSGWVSDIRYGRSLSLEFFRHNAWLIVAMLVAVLSLIGLRYKTKTKMGEIKALNQQLKQAESAKLQEKSAYMSLIRETEMHRLVNEQHLGLSFQEQPPFEVETYRN